MADQLQQLLDSLLWEGYALYPYTPTATKNATPTPFGIVYPPAYAEALTTTYDELELRCALQAPPDAILAARLRFLVAAGERHQAQEQTIELSGTMVGALAQTAARKQCSVQPDGGAPPLTIGVTLSARALDMRRWEVCFRVQNLTVVSSGLDRAGALARSLISTHPVVRVTGGRFVSPLEQPCASVNTFPVLATPDDDVVIGAAIVLPDHPADRPREPRRPVRLDRDRGGAAAPREGAERRRAAPRSSSRTRPCARWSSAPRPRPRRRSSPCTAA